MNISQDTYVVISPARNEAEYMRKTLDSVCGQSIPPNLWIIVDDGSTDDTSLILNEYTNKYNWIQVVYRQNRGHRSVGPGVIKAFYTGLKSVDYRKYKYLCKLDLDLELPNKYFEVLIEHCEKNPRIGSCSGKAYMKKDGKLISENIGDEMSVGASKFMRVSCFEEIGGFVREVMWDGIDCHTARMKGWKVVSWDNPDLNFIHLRPMGSSDKSIIKGRIRHGYGQHYMGGSLLYSLAAAIYRLPHPPVIIGGMASFWGHFYSRLKGLPQYEDIGFRQFLLRYQHHALVFGKKRATELMESESYKLWMEKHP